MPEVVTHRYHPDIGIYWNLCALPDDEALQVIDRLRREYRRTLKPNYLARRRTTEGWLADAASEILGRHLQTCPAYFFLGDFSHFTDDQSRPAALVIPLATLPRNSLTFTLGDSMTVAKQPTRRAYTYDDMVALFARNDIIAGFGLSDQCGLQGRFIELQLWR
jgi:hypothetical protein